jgi:hypothetical protein
VKPASECYDDCAGSNQSDIHRSEFSRWSVLGWRNAAENIRTLFTASRPRYSVNLFINLRRWEEVMVGDGMLRARATDVIYG